MMATGSKVGSTTYSGGSTLRIFSPSTPPLIVPPVRLRMRMLTVPLVPIGCDRFVPSRNTSTCGWLSTARVLRVAVSWVVRPVDVARIPPGGACTWQPHSTPSTVLLRFTQESVTRPTR